MKISFLPPPPDLRELVVTFWWLEGSPRGSQPLRPQRVLPDGCPELIFHYGPPPRRQQAGSWDEDPQAFVFGQLESFMELWPNGSSGAIGARLKASALGRLTQTAAHRLTGRPVDLEALWGSDGLAWSRRVLQCSSGPEALWMLTQGLRQRWDPRLPSRSRSQQIADAALKEIESHRGALPISVVSQRLACSTRQLERSFREEIGIGPKTLSRVVRFHCLQSHLSRPQRPSERSRGGAELALDFGFADQPHMIREFRSFSGTTPALFEASGAPDEASLWLL